MVIISYLDSEGTVEFLKKFNMGFDVFNCDKEIKGNVYKTPINATSKDTVFSFLDSFTDYIDKLKLHGKPVVTTGRKVPFIGFKSNSRALKMMYEEFVETNLIEKIQTTDLQQDLLESFFGRMRSKGGNNTNPTQEQFIGNFRRILLNKELTSSSLSNCVDKLEILHVSSTQSGQSSEVNDKSYLNFIMNISEQNQQNSEDSQDDEELDLENDEEETAPNDVVDHSETLGIANLAGLIEASLSRSKKLSCNNCSSIFESSDDKIDPVFFIKNKKNVLPSKSTYEICNIGRQVMKSYFTSTHISHFEYDKLFKKIKDAINYDYLFIRTNFERCDHKMFIIDCIIEEMVRMRCVAIARNVTVEQHKMFVRSAKTHDIHFYGQ